MILLIKSPKYGAKEVSYDEEDHELIMQYHWHVNYDPHTQGFYVCAHDYSSGRDKVVRLHRIITKCPKGSYVDHRDNNSLNNKKENLRICDNSENQMNSRKIKPNRSSRYKGVDYGNKKKKFRARIRKGEKILYLGDFKTEIEAALAYNKAAIEHFGEFALLNEIDPN